MSENPISGLYLAALIKDKGVEIAYGLFHQSYFPWISKQVITRLNREKKCPNPDIHGIVLTHRSLVKMYNQIMLIEKGEQAPIDNLEGYVFTIYRNLIIEHLQRHDNIRRRLVSIDTDQNQLIERIADARQNAESALISRDLLDQVTRMITQLPVKKRIAVEMTAYGHDSEEIGEALGISATNVRTWLHRFRKQLREKGIEI
jgi:RNA polymerase sigma factor (sigma-70 family)